MESSGLAGSPIVSDPPFYRRIVDDVRRRITLGADPQSTDPDRWPPGTKLPSTRELVAHYREALNSPALSTLTVRRAVDLLIESGELRGQQGVGVFVADS